MKKIILLLLILLTASFADFVIKKDGTLTKVIAEGSTPPKSNMPLNWPFKAIIVSCDTLKNVNINKDMISRIGEANFNTISIDMFFTKIMKKYNLNKEKAIIFAFDQTDKLIQKIIDYNKRTNHNIVVKLHVEDFPHDAVECSDRNKPSYWNSKQCLNDIYQLIDKTARHYAKVDQVVTYVFMAEPRMKINGKNYLPANWRGILDKSINIVRKYDKKKYISVTPSIGGNPGRLPNDYIPFNDDKIIYDFSMWHPHKYTMQGTQGIPYGSVYPGNVSGTWWDKSKLEDKFDTVIKFQKKYNVLISSIIGVSRLALGRDQYTKDSADIYQKHGFARFNYNGGNGLAGPYPGFNIFYDGTYANGKGKFTFVGDTSTLLLMKKLNSKK